MRKVLSLGRVQTPTLALIVNRDLAIAAFVPEDYWEVARPVLGLPRPPTTPGLWHEGSTTRLTAAEPAEAIAAAASGQQGVVESLETKPQVEAAAPPLRPHHAAARGQQPLRLLGHPHAQRGPGALRPAQAADLPAHQLAVPVGRHGGAAQEHRQRSGRRRAGLRRPGALRAGPRPPAPGARGQRRPRGRPPRDHPDRGRPRHLGPRARRARGSTTWSRGASWPSSTRRRASSAPWSRRGWPSTSSAAAAR